MRLLVPTVTDRIDGALLAKADAALRLIANFGAGTDHIDLEAARVAGSRSPTRRRAHRGYGDLVMALILMAPRRLGAGERILRAGEARLGPTDFLGSSVTGMKLGIVGMGRIGSAVARRAGACGWTSTITIAARSSPSWKAGRASGRSSTRCSAQSNGERQRALRAGHASYDRRQALALMKPGAWLINAARGGLVDQEAMIAALQNGRLGGVGLDVYPNEPEVDPRLLALPNVVLLPHMGSATIETRTAMGEKVVANIEAWMAGGELPNRVNPPGYGEGDQP